MTAVFRSLLIANRGEIAVRVIRTARAMGLRTVAVFSDADANAPHVRMADVAVRIGPAAARDSYLRAERILEAARATGAEAIHPGYGFLSERADFARAVIEAGLVWVGPRPDAIDAMGDKIRARALAAAAGVAVVPGTDGLDQDDARLAVAARGIGLPVMVKASAGGGGKGMRAVFHEGDVEAAIAAARREAQAAFGDGRVFVERLIERPRHVEVQVLGDRHGNLVHLHERDCSVQRANQKLVEEAPAPNLSATTRAALHTGALKLSAAIGYDSVGTVEFVLDAATEKFFFLEMNTRLQVEHTVTEEVTGLDLVELQLRAAAGEVLPVRQDDIRVRGHAIEARLTAERADEGFRPDAGPIVLFEPPAGLRVDAGVETGSEIGLSYDSMIAKLIAHGDTREIAIARLAAGLDRMTLLGPATTRAFLVDILAAPAFHEGRMTTRLIGETWPRGWPRPLEGLAEARRLAALAWWLAQGGGGHAGPWSTLPGFRLLSAAGQSACTSLSVSHEDETHRVAVTAGPAGFTVADPSGETAATARLAGDALVVRSDGVERRLPAIVAGGNVHLRLGSIEAAFRIAPLVEAAAAPRAVAASETSVTAPMPGLVAEIRITAGDRVAAGDTVAVLESMKLFMDLKAPAAGTVERIAAPSGTTVAAGALIVALVPDA